jgi:N-acetyl-alpha-D-glucosaminyl L-malate synthase BshA
MRLGITCYPTYGGSGVVAAELGRELARRGHTVHFIAYAQPQRFGQFEEGLFFHQVEVMTYPLFRYPPYTLALAAKMTEIAQSAGLDLLHVHYAIPHAVCAYLAKKMTASRDLKVVTTLHGTDITLVGNDASFFEITRFGIEESDGVTAVSQYLKNETVERFRIERDIEVISNFVDTVRFSRQTRGCERDKFASPDERVVMHVSNFRAVKRIVDIIEIFARIEKQVQARLLMIGDGPERLPAERRANELGIADRVTFLGLQDSIEDLLCFADLFLLPSEEESFGLSALEALACEVPVIGTDSGGLVEVVSHGETGYLAPIGAVEDMAAYAVSILEDSDKRDEMGKRARQRARELFETKTVVPRYEAYYESVMKS